MANALPLLLLGGAAILLLSKKKNGAGGTIMDVTPTDPPVGNTAGPSGSSASVSTWKQRQTALNFVGAMTKCDISLDVIDGKYGPNTKRAVRSFQACAGIGIDGKWGPKTEAAMSKMLADIARGQVKIYPPKTNGDHKFTSVEVVDIENDHFEGWPHVDIDENYQKILDNALIGMKSGPVTIYLSRGRWPWKVDSHTHPITLTAKQLQNLAAGQEVFAHAAEFDRPIGLFQFGPDHTHLVRLKAV